MANLNSNRPHGSVRAGWGAWLGAALLALGAQSQAQVTTVMNQPASPSPALAPISLSANASPGDVGRMVFLSGNQVLANVQVSVSVIYGECDPPASSLSRTARKSTTTTTPATTTSLCPIGSSASASTTLAAGTIPVGTYSLTARYTDLNGNVVSNSAAVTLVVTGATQAPPPPNSAAPIANYEYDAQGNATKVVQAPGIAGFGFTSQSSYDALSRRKNTIDARAGITQFGYDGQGSLMQVVDPRSLVTQYPRNGLGDVTGLVSPDTGAATHTYDAAGNLKTRTDSRGVIATNSFDALNRLTGTVFSKAGQPSLSLGWSYDQTGTGFSYGIGRLTSTSHPAGSTLYAYDAQGRLLSSTQRVSAAAGANSAQITSKVSYAYDGAGNITAITYPSARVVSFTYTGGQASALALAKNGVSTPTTLVEQIQFSPFGALKSLQWSTTSGPQIHERSFDLSGRLVRHRLGRFIRDITYDAADRITSYTHYDATSGAVSAEATALNQSFGYDELGRLLSVTASTSTWVIGYDANGNRTGVTLNGVARTYATAATSNRLNSLSNPVRSFGYDAAGNTISDSGAGYAATYDLAGRMVTLNKGAITTTYSHDAMGRRVRKFSSSGASTTLLFVYDQAGQLLGEYDASGAPVREYIWLGSTLVGIFTPDSANSANPPLVYFVHSDHLNTPRVVVDRANNLRWRWMAEPFGVSAAEPNPSGLGTFTLNLRLPGQYFDQESALHYNYFRDYDSSLGRYVQSDPIGLAGGVNTYAYVDGNPLMYIDPYGLWALGDPLPQGLLDFSAGMGDVILFGQGQRLRDLFDVDGGIDPCSSEYSAGEWAGVGVSAATGFAGGLKAAGAKGAGKEFSHWIPNRMGGPRSVFNGNYVSTPTHALSDPYRYRFMPRSWKAQNPMPNKATQQLVRIPNVYKGGAAGGAYGAGGAGLSGDCTCQR